MDRSKPILFISPLPPPIGGIATWTQTLLKYGLPNQTPITLVNTCLRGKRNIFDKANLSLMEIWRSFSVICNLLYQLILKRPKLVHLNSALSSNGILRDVLCAQLIRLFAIPLVTHYHGHAPDYKGKKQFLRKLLRLSKLNIFSNSLSLNFARELTTAACMMLPNFIADERFCYQKKKSTVPRLQILYAGGITTAKGANEIIALARRFIDCDFNLYGKLHHDMNAAIWPRNCILHGEVAHDKLLEVMSQSDVLLFPSHTEGFPLTVLEAMTVGLPIIATNVGAINDMVVDGLGGYVVKVGDIDLLSNAIKQLHLYPDLRLKMGIFNQQRSFDEYRYSKVIENLYSIYGQVLCAA